MSQWSCHIDVEREIQLASHRPYTWERLSINFQGELSQDQSALLNSRLNLPMELFAVVGGVGE
jgi:hypothetical protein